MNEPADDMKTWMASPDFARPSWMTQPVPEPPLKTAVLWNKMLVVLAKLRAREHPDAMPPASDFLGREKLQQEILDLRHQYNTMDYSNEAEPQAAHLAETAAAEVATQATPAMGEPAKNLPWWQSAYDIQELAQTIGSTIHARGDKPSQAAVAKGIASRIVSIERSAGRDRSINWDTVRGALTGWKFKPETA